MKIKNNGINSVRFYFKLENNILTLISEGQPISDLVVRDIDRVIFSIPINELEGYSHWRRSDKLYLYVNGKRFALDFPHLFFIRYTFPKPPRPITAILLYFLIMLPNKKYPKEPSKSII